MRTIFFFLLVLSLFWAGDVFAQTTGNEYIWKRGGTEKPFYKDANSGCAAAHYTPQNMYAGTGEVLNGGAQFHCYYKDNRDTTPTYYYGQKMERLEVKKCATGTFRNWATGACDKPPEEEKKCKDAVGAVVRVTMHEGFGPIGSELPTRTDGVQKGFPRQTATCKINKASTKVEYCASELTALGDEKRFTCTYSSTSTGEEADVADLNGIVSEPNKSQATGTNMPPKEAPDTGCPKGSVPGGVDSGGITICMGSGVDPIKPSKTPETSTTKTETSEAGNNVKTTTDVKTNSDGSKTTTTTVVTTTPGGVVDVVKTQETTKAADGTGGKEDAPQPDLCKANPNLSICKVSSVAGKCASVSCSGDAIQCSTLQQAAAMRCAADEERAELKASAAYSLGAAVMAGSDPFGASLPKPGNAVTIGVPTSLTTTGWLGGGSCFADKSVSVMGKTVTLPFSKACEYLVVFRYALMVMASLVSFKILRGSFLSE